MRAAIYPNNYLRFVGHLSHELTWNLACHCARSCTYRDHLPSGTSTCRSFWNAWLREDKRDYSTQRKVAISARPYVSFNFLIKYHSIELETIPLNENEYEKGQHSLIIAPGKIAQACVVCDSRTRYFCYGCSADVPTVVHCCSSSRDGGRDCFANLHRVRKPNHQGDTRIFHRRRQRFKDPEKPQSRQLRGSKKGCKLNPHHTT